MQSGRHDLLRVTRVPHEDHDLTVLVVAGELDLHTEPLLVEALDGSRGTVVLDLSELTFVDSAGIHALVESQKDITRQGGSLRLVYGPGQQIARVM
ncbi:MAG: anti-sigma-factor antagonist, partial [Frankiales bacterium]|nr:anti-sigma-factor antagonist [Frankiales bacterium]